MARAVRPGLLNGAIGLVMAPHGRLTRALTFRIVGGKITEIDVIGEAPRLEGLDVAMTE